MLNDASSLGTLQSEGSFTIAGDAAIGKLAAFQLPRQSAWILKVIQAAVTSGAPSLKIGQSHQSTTFEYEMEPTFSIAELKEALLKPQLGKVAPAVGHLAVGLRAVGFGDKRAFTLAYDADGVRTFLGWNGSSLVQRGESSEPTTRPRLHLGVAFPPEDLGRRLAGFAKSKGRATSEYLEVVHNGEVCPIPLLFDGRRLDRLAAPLRDKIDGQSVILSVGWTPAAERDEACILLPQGLHLSNGLKATDKFDDDRVFHLDGPKQTHRVSSIGKLRYGFKIDHYGSKHRQFEYHSVRSFSEYCWVKDGIVCHRQASLRDSSPISFQLFLPADDLATDVSGLSLSGSPKLERRMSEGRERLEFQMQNTIEALDGHVPKPFKRDTLIYGWMGALFTVTGLVTFGKSLIGAAVAGAALTISASNKKQIMEDCKYHLRRFGDSIRNPEPVRGRGRKPV